MEELLRGYGCNPAAPSCTHWSGERGFTPGVAVAVCALVVCAIVLCAVVVCAVVVCAVLCTALCACLKQSQDQHKCYKQSERSDSEKQLETSCLKAELRRERERVRLLQQKNELVLTRAKTPASVAQSRKLIAGMDPEDGDIRRDSNENSVDEVEEAKDVSLPLKTEKYTGPHGRKPQTAVRTIRWTEHELSCLQDKFSRKPGETETEYLWRVSLTGGDRILLSNDEAGGFWGPGVFLSGGPDGDRSLTSRVAYWAGGVDPREREEPVTIRIRRLSELSEGVQKAACIQAMYEKGQQGIPVAAPVNPTHLRPLIRGLPNTLKMYVQSLREKIQLAVELNQQNPQNPVAHVLTWSEMLHNIVTYRREMGWPGPGGGSTDKSRRVGPARRKPCPRWPPRPRAHRGSTGKRPPSGP